MGYYESVLRDRPFSAFRQNATGAAYEDITGGGATLTGTLAFGASILSGHPKSIYIADGNELTVTTSVFKTGMHMYPFSLEAKFLNLTNSAQIGVLSHSGDFDGLTFDGDYIRFGVKSLSGTVTTASWPVPDHSVEAFHTFGVYTAEKIQLYVNGLLVDETEIPDEIKTDGFATQSLSGNLVIGDSAVSTEKMLVDGIAIYAWAVPGNQIYEHYLQSIDVINKHQAVRAKGGTLWSGENRPVAIHRLITGSDWNVESLYDRVGFTSGHLVPTVDQTTGLSNPGEWTTSVPVSATEDTSLSGVKVEWDGDGGFSVESSIDHGQSWSQVSNGRLLDGSFGLDATTTTDILIRVTFDGGIADDESTVRSLSYSVYTDNTSAETNTARLLTFNDLVATSNEVNEPIERNQSGGIDSYGGSFFLTADSDEVTDTTRTIEMWVTPRGTISGTGGYLFDTRSGGTAYLQIPTSTNALTYAGLSNLYINGSPVASGAFSVEYGQPLHIVAVTSGQISSQINFATANLDARYDMVALYPWAMSSTNALDLYMSYTFVRKYTINDSSTIAIAEEATPFNMYNYAWDISAGG